MLWICNGCTAAYSPGAPRCPQCGSTDYREQGEEMAKITVHGGPSNLAAEEDPASDVVKSAPAGPSITGGGWGNPADETQVEQTGDNRPDLYDPDNLTYPYGGGDPYTEGPDGTKYYEPKTLEVDEDEPTSASVAVTPPVEEAVDYDAFTVGQLRELLADRTLPVSGTKPELVARLTEDDTARTEDVEVSDG